MRARTLPFDTLQFANRMKSAGMEPKLAEAQAEAISAALYDGIDIKLDNLLTKEEFKAAMAASQAEFSEFKTETKVEFEKIRAETKVEFGRVRTEMAEMRSELIKWMVGLTFSSLAILSTLMTILQFVKH